MLNPPTLYAFFTTSAATVFIYDARQNDKDEGHYFAERHTKHFRAPERHSS